MAEPQDQPTGHAVHDVCPAKEYVPGAQVYFCAVIVEGHAEPAGHWVQFHELPAAYVPGAHAVIVEDEVDVQANPATQRQRDVSVKTSEMLKIKLTCRTACAVLLEAHAERAR